MYLAVRCEERYTVFMDYGKNLPDLADVSLEDRKVSTMRQGQILRAIGKGLAVIVALGATCAGVYYVYSINFPAAPIEEARLSPEERENLESYSEREARIAEEEIAKGALLGLEEIYTRVHLVADVIHYLYEDKNFKNVTEQLVQYRDKGKTPYERYRYSQQ